MNFEKDRAMAKTVAAAVAQRGGRAYYVGGYVRDRLMGKENKDIDLEVHGVTPAVLEEILDGLGDRISIGESFGIYALRGYSVDIAMPRKEALRGVGHRDFDIAVDPFVGIPSAAMRRDFTVNAMMQDVLTEEIHDPFDGRADLARRVIRHVNDVSFAEDALRVLRAAQFAARFEFSVAEETKALCARMDLTHLPRERIMEELKKALLKARRPSLFFTTLREMGQLSPWFAEAEALIGVAQDPKFHPEGDVWTHTMMVLDEAASYRAELDRPLGLMLAALTHDLGKTICSERVGERIHAYRHETLGLPLVRRFMTRLTNETKLIREVINLTELHMKPNIAAAHAASVKSTNKMFDQAIDPEALILLALSDGGGKKKADAPSSARAFLEERLRVYREMMARPYVTGGDLMQAGLTPDTSFSEILAYAHKLRLAGVEKESALRQTLAYARKLPKRS